MRARFDDYFSTMARLKSKDAPAKEKLDQLNRLSKQLEDWGTLVFPEISFQMWLNYDEYGNYPFAGSFMDQPSWVREEFTHWTLVKRWHEINEDLPSIDGLPTLADLT